MNDIDSDNGTDCYCHTCGKSFLTRSAFISHLRVHNLKYSFACEFCQRIFTKQSKMFKHRRRIHIEKLVYSCDICGKTFKLCASLKTHERRHSDHYIPTRDSIDMFVIKKIH